MLACIGINPSTATPGKLDNTLQSVKRIAGFNGYDGWVMYNVYPQRSTNPSEIHGKLDIALHTENIKHIRDSVIELKINTVWLAFGDLLMFREYLPYCMYMIYEALKDLCLSWRIAGTITKKGHPRHPLYQSAKVTLIEFDIEAYIREKIKPAVTSGFN
jgi:hypothetical protein